MIMSILRISVLALILIVSDTVFDSFLKTGGIDGRYIFKDAWVNTVFFEVLYRWPYAFILKLIVVRLNSPEFYRRKRR